MLCQVRPCVPPPAPAGLSCQCPPFPCTGLCPSVYQHAPSCPGTVFPKPSAPSVTAQALLSLEQSSPGLGCLPRLAFSALLSSGSQLQRSSHPLATSDSSPCGDPGSPGCIQPVGHRVAVVSPALACSQQGVRTPLRTGPLLSTFLTSLKSVFCSHFNFMGCWQVPSSGVLASSLGSLFENSLFTSLPLFCRLS